ncbi:MAG: GNAT family N-acetyltransferase, partial [Varibaculum timonense]
QEGVYLLVFRSEEGKILGMLSLATFKIPTGKRAWIEDVVVDSAARGQGAGQALVEAAVRHAKKVGAKTVDLTSRPTREAANRLYRRCGFKQRQTNVYRYADN